jgi:hypothetical protein
MARSPRTRFAAPFVVVVTAAGGGCSDGKGGGTTTPPEPKPQQTWNVSRSGDQCYAHQPISCPKNATCNPPAPMMMPCPPEKPDGSFKVVSFDGKSCFLEDGTTTVTCPTYDYVPPPPPPAIDAAVAVAAQLRTWRVQRSAKDCFAAPEPDPCTQFQRKPGDPIPPCNPPEPIKLKACPPVDVVAIVETATDVCETDSDVPCDPGVKCNPPAPSPIPCPRY